MSNRGIISLFILIVLLVLLHFTNPPKDKHVELLKTKLSDEYSVDMEDDSAFSRRFGYSDYYFFSFTTDEIGDTHPNTSIGFLGFVF